MSTSQILRRAFLMIAACVGPAAQVNAQQVDAEPPPILRGGIVHQLRSLTEDALGTRESAKGGKPSSSIPRRGPTQRLNSRLRDPVSLRARPEPSQHSSGDALPAQPAVPQRKSSPLSEWFSRSRQQSSSPAIGQQRSATVSPSPQREPEPFSGGEPSLAEIITPEQAMARYQPKTQPSAGRQDPEPDESGLVHIEKRLPQEIRQSLQGSRRNKNSEARSGTADGQKTETERFATRAEGATANRQTSPETARPNGAADLRGEVYTNAAPSVSRIPLPGGGRAKPSPTQAPQRSTVATDTAKVNPDTTSSRVSSEPSSPATGGLPVSVPTKLVTQPAGQPRQRPDVLPELPALPAAPSHDQQKQASLPVAGNPTRAMPNQPAVTRSPQAVSGTPRAASGRAIAGHDERMRMVTPRVQVTLRGPSDVPVGTPANYEIVVKNDDTMDLSGLIVRLDIPSGVKAEASKPSRGDFAVERAGDGATLLTWGVERLAAGRTESARLQLVANSAQNFALAMEWVLVPVTGSSDIAVLSPQLELALEGPAEVNFGEPSIYRLHVKNPGTAPAKDVAVTLSAEPYGASSSELGEIPAGGEETIDVELTFNQRGNIRIAASAEAAGDWKSDTAIDVLVRMAELTAQVSAPQVVYHGTATDFQVRVENTGDAAADDLQATVRLPSGCEVVSMPPGAARVGDELAWPISSLPAGKSEDFTLQLNLTQEGENPVEFDCSTTSGLTAKTSASTFVRAIADLTLLVNDPVAPAPVGGEVTYELTLTNRGSKAASNVYVVAQFSEGIEPTRGEGHAARVVPGQVLFEPIDSIGAGQTVKLEVFARAGSDGMHRFRAEVRSDESEVRLVQEESTQYLDTIRRTASPTGSQVIR